MRVSLLVCLPGLAALSCKTPERSASSGQAAEPPVPSATVAGRLLRGPLLEGYESIDATDPAAKEVVESGGIVLRIKGDPKGTPIGVAALVDFPVDPTNAEVCTAGASASATNSGMSVAAAEVIHLGDRQVCRSRLTLAGATLESWSILWVADASTKLGAMVVCSLDPSDAPAVQACEAFASGVVPM